MNVHSSFHVQNIFAVQAKPPDPREGRVFRPIMLCLPATMTPRGALHLEHKKLVGIYSDNGWLSVQLPRENVGLLGLPLTGTHPSGTWEDAWLDDRIDLFCLRGWEWELVAEWDDLPLRHAVR